MDGKDIASIATGGLGMIADQIGAGQQYRRSKKLMGLQKDNQMELNQQGHDLSYAMWEKTNYDAQMRQMEKAGLNVGLMYGGGGAGGGTASTGSGGSASAGSAPQTNMGGMAMQMGLMQAQKENIEADTAKKKVETENTGTVAREGMTLDNQLKSQTMGSIVEKAFYDARIADNTEMETGVRANLSADTVEAQKVVKENEAIISSLEIGLKEIGIAKTRAEIEYMAEQIKIGKFNANVNADSQGLDKVAGTQLNNLINEIYGKLGNKNKTKEIK